MPVTEVRTKLVATVMVHDPDTGHEVAVEIRKRVDSGLLFGIEETYVNAGWDHVTDPYGGRDRLLISKEATQVVAS